MVKLKIDNYEVEATAGTSILEAARSVHIEIPTLCKHPDVDATAGCEPLQIDNLPFGRLPGRLRAYT